MREPRDVAAVVMRFHRRLDEVVAQTVSGHGVKLACAPGCSYCCHLRVEVQPQEAFALAEWLRRRFDAARLAALVDRLRANVEATRGPTPRGNVACALLAADGTCGAYEARPAACRRMHSLDVAACRTAYENPLDASLEVPANAALSHNAAVIAAQAQQATREEGLDADSVEMNFALLEALDNPKAWRRWRDGKKPFPASRG
jgi:putative zinc- or iron-chelating protein